MEIRMLTREDAESFRRLRLAALKECPSAFTADYAANLQRPLTHFAAQIQSLPDNFIVGAFHDGTLAGMAGFYRSEGPKLRHKGNIWGMYVAPDLRGSGVGRKLLQEIIAKARTFADIVQLHLSVVADNAKARTLYLSSGFEIVGCEPRAVKVDGKFLDEDRLILRLRE
jgi:GNAT superfamily N-acetyltransferase